MEATTASLEAENQQNHDEDNYSEWRVVFSDGKVTKNKGFQVRDFQSSKGGLSVIDPVHFRAIYGDLTARDRITYIVAGDLVVGLFAVLLGIGLAKEYFNQSERRSCRLVVASFLVFFFAISSKGQWFSNADAKKMKDLVEKIQKKKAFFLEEYNIELGLSSVGDRSDDGGNSFDRDGFYLRRPRIVTDQEVMEGRDCEVLEIQDSAPIFLTPFIPGDLNIDMK